MEKTVVSICCQTYNHVNYIEQCLEGFLMQKTDFKFEILLRDDASTDGTTDIVKKYVNKYPEIIKPLIYKENQFQKGISPFKDNVKRAIGKYIAICEGDDYWTDTLKLQKQVDLMEKYQEASMCVALNEQHYVNGEIRKDKSFNGKNFPLVYFADLSQYFHTSTYLIQKSLLDILMDKYVHLFLGDTSLRYLLIVKGPFVVLNDFVSVYRINGQGVWTSLSEEKKNLAHYNLYAALYKGHKCNHAKHYIKSKCIFALKLFIFYFRKGSIFNAISYLYKATISLLDYIFYLK
jgi:glycosyltransferase involved in cell wall biosynthesis